MLTPRIAPVSLPSSWEGMSSQPPHSSHQSASTDWKVNVQWLPHSPRGPQRSTSPAPQRAASPLRTHGTPRKQVPVHVDVPVLVASANNREATSPCAASAPSQARRFPPPTPFACAASAVASTLSKHLNGTTVGMDAKPDESTAERRSNHNSDDSQRRQLFPSGADACSSTNNGLKDEMPTVTTATVQELRRLIEEEGRQRIAGLSRLEKSFEHLRSEQKLSSSDTSAPSRWSIERAISEKIQDLRVEFLSKQFTGASKPAVAGMAGDLGDREDRDSALSWWTMATERLGSLDERLCRIDEQMKTQSRATAHAKKCVDELKGVNDQLGPQHTRTHDRISSLEANVASVQRESTELHRERHSTFVEQHKQLGDRLVDVEAAVGVLKTETSRVESALQAQARSMHELLSWGERLEKLGSLIEEDCWSLRSNAEQSGSECRKEAQKREEAENTCVRLLQDINTLRKGMQGGSTFSAEKVNPFNDVLQGGNTFSAEKVNPFNDAAGGTFSSQPSGSSIWPPPGAAGSLRRY